MNLIDQLFRRAEGEKWSIRSEWERDHQACAECERPLGTCYCTSDGVGPIECDEDPSQPFIGPVEVDGFHEVDRPF